jgi:hypothetical protein
VLRDFSRLGEYSDILSMVFNLSSLSITLLAHSSLVKVVVCQFGLTVIKLYTGQAFCLVNHTVRSILINVCHGRVVQTATAVPLVKVDRAESGKC